MNSSSNGSSRGKGRHFSVSQKAAIVKAHLIDKVPISDLCERRDHGQPVLPVAEAALLGRGDRLRDAAQERRPRRQGPADRSARGQAGQQERGHQRANGGVRALKKLDGRP
jgi:hypothetical protein